MSAPTRPIAMRIGLHDYEVIDWKTTTAMAANRYGECSTQERQIRVAHTHGARQAASTLLHEIMHACFAEWHMDSEDREERTVATMSEALSCVWRDNLDAFVWIAYALQFDDG